MLGSVEKLMIEAQNVAKESRDRRTKVGCIIVSADHHILSKGCNSFPRGVDEDIEERHLSPEKYYWTEHAERNAIYNAARSGVALLNSTMYLPWFPCTDFARAIVQSGITKLVAIQPDLKNERWGHEFERALHILKEGGVNIELYEDGTQQKYGQVGHQKNVG